MPKYCEYSKYGQYRIPEYFKYRVFPSIERKHTQVQQYSTELNPKGQRVWQYSQYRILKYCEY